MNKQEELLLNGFLEEHPNLVYNRRNTSKLGALKRSVLKRICPLYSGFSCSERTTKSSGCNRCSFGISEKCHTRSREYHQLTLKYLVLTGRH